MILIIVFDKKQEKWLAEIHVQKKKYYLGRLDKFEDAVAVRKEAEENLSGNFLKWYAGKCTTTIKEL